MFAPVLLLASSLVLGTVSLAQSTAPYLTGYVGNKTIEGNGTAPDKNGKWHISSEGITAYFIPYGASISNLFITDKNGTQRDIVLGYDNATYYTEDTAHPYFGPAVGRYANRVKNSTWTYDGITTKILPNENNGSDTLHGGPDGWTWRNWTVTTHTTDSITFSLTDPDGSQGFPGEVVAYVTYTVTPYQWHIRMVALSLTKTTPIMMSSHTYWNLDGFANPETPLVLNHTLNMPYSGMRVDIDNIEIPTGILLPNQQYSVNDFYTAPKQLGANITSPDLLGACGYNCTGYDTCYIISRDAGYPYDWVQAGPVATLASDWSGISVDIYTDQQAFQIYTCNNQNGAIPIKSTQGLSGNSTRPRVVEKYGCIVMEVEDWIDGINQPQWGRNKRQFFGPGDPPYTLNAVYDFSVGTDTPPCEVDAYGLPGSNRTKRTVNKREL